MKKILFKGAGSAIPTPFNENGVNIEELKRFLKFQIENKIDSLIVCGTTGESSTMTRDEKIETIKCAVEVSNGKVPVIAGTGSNNTKDAIEMSKIAENINIPIILYNVPSRTGLNINPETCFELSKIENIVAIKEASGNISQIAQIAHLCGDNLHIYSGNDDQAIPICSLGGLGVISVLSNLKPAYTHDMIWEFLNGNFELAKKMQLDSIPLINALFSEVNPIPVKAALNEIGFYFGVPRLPLMKMSEEKKKIISNNLLSI